MANTITSDSIELRVLRILGESVFEPQVRSSILEGTFVSYLKAEELRREGDYERLQDFAYDYMVCSFLSKWKGWETGIKLDQVALDSWTAAELKCLETNRRLSGLRLRGSDPRVLTFVSEVQRKISAVLGSFSSFQAFERSRWSSGATTLTRRGATVHEKMSAPVAVTPAALGHVRRAIEHDPVWGYALLGIRPSGPYSLLKSNFNVIKYNRWMTVPKSAKTDRSIGAEPAGNAFLQQGVGKYIRHRLKRFGVDLDDQSNNQRAAELSAVRKLATLDLKAASDTVSRELVWLLLPVKWAELLDDLRSTHSKFPDGRLVRLEKFSSMGNAFTFELEALIFWAIVTTASGIDLTAIEPDARKTQLLVYGDDIICPSEHASAVIEWLNYFGFDVNHDKSFVEGPFYESCGLHVYKGCDVTPIYQKEVCKKNPAELIRLANRLYRWLIKHEAWLTQDQVLSLGEAIHTVREIYPLKRLPEIPDTSVSDDGFLMPRSLVEGRYCPNRRAFLTTVLRYQPTTTCDDVLVTDAYGVTRMCSLSYLSLKLRDPKNSFSDHKGHIQRVIGGGWIQARAWVHA